MKKVKIQEDNSRKRGNRSSAAASKNPPSPIKSDSCGVTKRFLDWLARGAEKMNKSGSFCPT